MHYMIKPMMPVNGMVKYSMRWEGLAFDHTCLDFSKKIMLNPIICMFDSVYVFCFFTNLQQTGVILDCDSGKDCETGGFF